MKPFVFSALMLLLAGPTPASADLKPVPTPPSASAGGHSFAPLFSGDGRHVLFLSQANNLVSNDDLGSHLDVFVRDLETGLSTLASVNTTGVGGGNADAGAPAISFNGQFIAFESAASNLVPNDTNRAGDVFLRDLASGTTRLVSVSSSGLPGQGDSRHPLLSGDGSRVLFESAACNLTAETKAADTTDIFVRDLARGLTRLVSVSVDGAATREWNRRTELCSISSDGRQAAFLSTRTDLAPGVTNAYGDVFVRDLEANTTCWASSEVANRLGAWASSYRCFGAVLSADGRSVVFKVETVPAIPAAVWVFRRGLQDGLTDLLSSNALPLTWPTVSADGRYVAYDAAPAGQAAIFVWDASTRTSDAVTAGLGAGARRAPVLSADGTALAFVSLLNRPVSNRWDFVPFQAYAGRRTATNDRIFDWQVVTVNLAGQPSLATHETVVPTLSPDGTQIAFESTDETLVADDWNLATDVYVRGVNGGTTQLVSQRLADRPAVTSASGTCPAEPDCLSADGRCLVFRTYHNNLAVQDTNRGLEVVALDMVSGISVTLGVSSNDLSGRRLSVPAGGFVPTNVAMGRPTVSANGRYLAFAYPNPGLLQPSTLYLSHFYRYDLLSNVLERLTVGSNGALPHSPGATGSASLSEEGRLVAFQCQGNLDPGVSKSSMSLMDVYLRDVTAGTNLLLSRAGLSPTGPPADRTGNGNSTVPQLSRDSRWVLFQSAATDLPANGPSFSGTELFAYQLDAATNPLHMVSLSGSRTSALGYTPAAAFSADSRFIVFGTVSNRVFVHDLARQANELVAEDLANPSISGNGRLVVAETRGTAPTQIVLRDRASGLTNLISANASGTGGGNGPSTSPLLTPNGRYVVFASQASDLVPDDANAASDIFVRDLQRNLTLLVSRGPTGQPGRGASVKPVLGADGATVVFTSLAPDLVAGDYNDARDLFVLRFAQPDSDADGLDDDWEMAYFSTLARDGTGDFDGDGLTDFQEFLAGTDPTNAGSVLRVFILRSVSSPAVTLLWPATPGRTYHVQYKDDLATGPWTDLPGQPEYAQNTGAQQDTTAAVGARRFYRVILGN